MRSSSAPAKSCQTQHSLPTAATGLKQRGGEVVPELDNHFPRHGWRKLQWIGLLRALEQTILQIKVDARWSASLTLNDAKTACRSSRHASFSPSLVDHWAEMLQGG